MIVVLKFSLLDFLLLLLYNSLWLILLVQNSRVSFCELSVFVMDGAAEGQEEVFDVVLELTKFVPHVCLDFSFHVLRLLVTFDNFLKFFVDFVHDFF